jgi:hypothetical protein
LLKLMRTPEALAVLERTPAAVRGLLAGVGDAWLDADEGPDTFSPRDVLGHLILGEETDWVPRVKIILEHGAGRPFTPFDRFGFKERYGGRPVEELLARFEGLRATNLDYVRSLALKDEQLGRPGAHPGLGAVTLGQLLAAWVVHDLGHLVQIARVMAKRYTQDVGPWREYLTVLDR